MGRLQGLSLAESGEGRAHARSGQPRRCEASIGCVVWGELQGLGFADAWGRARKLKAMRVCTQEATNVQEVKSSALGQLSGGSCKG